VKVIIKFAKPAVERQADFVRDGWVLDNVWYHDFDLSDLSPITRGLLLKVFPEIIEPESWIDDTWNVSLTKNDGSLIAVIEENEESSLFGWLMRRVYYPEEL
jgi:hypothetical protein